MGLADAQNESARFALLLKTSTALLETFNPRTTTLDAYFQDAEFLQNPLLGEVELNFVHQVFYGCHRYSKLLKLFVTSFIYKEPTTALRSEQPLYNILAYLLFFRLEEVGIENLRQFVNCGYGSPPALSGLLQYAMDKEELEKWVMEEWLKHYDPCFLEEEIMGRLHRKEHHLRPLLNEMELKATGMLKSGGEAGPPGTVKSKRPLTDFQPFNLTAVKPRLIAEPDHHIEKDLIANPVPGFLNKTNLAKIADERKRQMEENKAKVAMKYSAADEFTFETAQRRDHASVLEELRAKAEEKFMEECTFQPQAAKRIVPRDDAMVRQTVASVLKEDARLRQAMAKDAELLKQYEAELHDASHFYEWQEKMKKKDDMDEEARMKERLIQTQLTRESAKEAHDASNRLKGIQAEHQKRGIQAQLDVRDKEQEAELEEKQKLVEHTCEEREKARIAEQEVLSLKQETAEQRWKEKELEMSKKKKEEELEMDRKRDLIRQIRALERVPRESAKVFDRAEAPGHGLLEEMSMAELKERLKVMHAHHQRALFEKRERQLAKKAEKEELLTEKVQLLAKVREQARDHMIENRDHMRKQRLQDEAKKDRQRGDVLMEVAARLENKKKEKKDQERRLRKELHEIATKQQFQMNSLEALEGHKNA
ncbi:Cilia- and flagella-associated protein 99, partial [Durusdinium trenchii]